MKICMTTMRTTYEGTGGVCLHVRVMSPYGIRRVILKYKENFGETIFGRIFEGSLVVGRWSVGGWPTTYRPPFYGAACSQLPKLMYSNTIHVAVKRLDGGKPTTLQQTH